MTPISRPGMNNSFSVRVNLCFGPGSQNKQSHHERYTRIAIFSVSNSSGETFLSIPERSKDSLGKMIPITATEAQLSCELSQIIVFVPQQCLIHLLYVRQLEFSWATGGGLRRWGRRPCGSSPWNNRYTFLSCCWKFLFQGPDGCAWTHRRFCSGWPPTPNEQKS